MTISESELRTRVEERHGGKIKILEYAGSSELGKFLCNVCGHIWSVTFINVANRTGCPRCCRLKDRLTPSYVRDFIESKNCKLISGEYVTSTSKLLIEFECGHSHEIVWNDFQQGKRCTICGIKKRNDSRKTKIEDIISFLKDNDFEFIGFIDGFKTQKTSLVQYKCKNGHVTTREVDRIYKYNTCNVCKMEYLSDIHMGNKNPQWNNGSVSIVSFVSNNLKEWKKESAKQCGYRCVITGEIFKDIHHLYAKSLIIRETLRELNIPKEKNIGGYSEEKISEILDIIIRKHDEYPLGVCLTRYVHNKFHSLYGKRTTPDQWYDFVNKIKNKEIILDCEVII